MMESSCPDTPPTFELPQVLLQEYPDVAAVRTDEIRRRAVAVYYNNRTMQALLESLAQGRPVRGVTNDFVTSFLAWIGQDLEYLRSSRAADQLTHFLTSEAALLTNNYRRWSDVGT